MHIYFPNAKDPDYTGEYSTCVIETEADLEVAHRKATAEVGKTPNNSNQQQPATPGLQYYKLKNVSDAKCRRLQQNLIRKLMELYPQLEGHIEEGGVTTLGPFRVGLSHRPERFGVPGLRVRTPIENLYLGGADLVLGNFAGSLLGGWLATHAVLGYGSLDLLLLQRNLNEDLKNVHRPKI